MQPASGTCRHVILPFCQNAAGGKGPRKLSAHAAAVAAAQAQLQAEYGEAMPAADGDDDAYAAAADVEEF